MTRRKPLRLGIIGLGMGSHHATAALGVPGVEISALADQQPERVERFYARVEERHGRRTAERLRERPVFADYRAMVAAGACDAVLDALPTHLHAASSTWLLRHGVHVLCEKPPTVDAREAKRVAAAARATGLTYAFVRQQRWSPALQTARKLVARGRCGEIYHAESKWIRSCGIPFRGGWGVNRDHGGGVLLDLGIHKLDDAWYVMGCPQPTAAFCTMHCSFAALGEREKLGMPYDADDGTFGVVRFANGASLTFAVTFAMNTAGDGHRPFDADRGRIEWQELAVYGPKAGIDVPGQRLVKRSRCGRRVTVAKLPVDGYRGGRGSVGMIADFAKAIRTGGEPSCTADQAVMLMQMLEALKRSAERGRSVAIKPYTA